VAVKGFQFGYHEKINDHFYMGVDFNNMIYSEHTPRQTYYSTTGDLTTDFYKYVVSYGGVLAGEYYFSPDKRLVPFVGLGVGANYNSYSLYYNIYSSKDDGWGVLVRPQAGVIFKLGQKQSWGIIAAVHYDYSTAKSTYFNYSNFNSLGLRVGIVVTKLFD
jgi:outer membrane protein W